MVGMWLDDVTETIGIIKTSTGFSKPLSDVEAKLTQMWAHHRASDSTTTG
jgi:hypothetical protein